jgi:hypothetical protein
MSKPEISAGRQRTKSKPWRATAGAFSLSPALRAIAGLRVSGAPMISINADQLAAAVGCTRALAATWAPYLGGSLALKSDAPDTRANSE